MAKVILGNHASVFVPRQDRDRIRQFYRDVLGGTITREQADRDNFQIGDNFHLAFLYGDYADESEFLRSGRSIWLELKSDDVEEMGRKILTSGVVRKLDVPDNHLYFQAPGGQCLRLVGINEDLSKYEGIGEGPNVRKIKEAVARDFRAGVDAQRKAVTSADGLQIVYSVAGAGDTTLVFLHGGMADRTFFDGQLAALSDRYRIVAVDLAGHGESGTARDPWTIERAGDDVARVVEAEKLKRVILFGNSLGGPVAIEAALRLGDRVLGVVGIDTFQDIGHPDTPEYARAVAEELRRRDELKGDYEGTVHAMIKLLFHPDADPRLVQDTERRVLRTSHEATLRMLAGIARYDSTPSARKLTVPLRAINGDLWPTDLDKIRTVKPDFDAILLKHVGHYPMLERPAEFNEAVLRVVTELTRRGGGTMASLPRVARDFAVGD